jgi:phosphoribosylamine---glycine ligase
MKILLVGGGGREDALAWALARSRSTRLLRCAPGNAGIARHAERVDIAAEDVESLASHARRERYDLVVVGPEAPLVGGLADRLRQAGLAVFGPSQGAAEIEGSKVFAKRFMERHGIPTADFEVFEDAELAARYLDSSEVSYPVVVKADGLAAGKGVVIAPDRAAAAAAATEMLVGKRFGAAGSRIVIEAMLHGREASFFVLCDGERFVELATCRDYKRAEDADRGPNTGGMGGYSPSPDLTPALRRELLDSVVAATVEGLASEGHPYRGVLYIGVMLTADGPRVLEYNARFGDPETQLLVPRLDGDWLPALAACATGTLSGFEPRWKKDAAVCVVMTSGGYPGAYAKGCRIEGIGEAESDPGVTVFHAGTSQTEDGGFATAGGRVLGVTALGPTLGAARERAYRAVGRIRWENEHHRSDIALDAEREFEGRETA